MMILAVSDHSGTGIFFFIALALFITIGLFFSRDPGRKDRLKRVARHVGGTFVDGGWIGEPRVAFRVAGRDAVLSFFAGARGSPPNTRISVSLGGLFPGTLHILEDGFAQSFLKLFGAQDLEIGDELFDRDYVVKASPESLAARVFSPERRADVIRTVRMLTGRVDPTIDVTPQQMTVVVREYVRDEKTLVALAEIAKDFLGYVLADPRPAPTPPAEGVCRTCGNELRDRVVHCEYCKTPHHPECWAYMGRCATYACPGLRTR